MKLCRVAIEAGTHSPWVSRLLAELGHEGIVANPRKLRLIYQNNDKCDQVDARYLARVARLDPTLLAPLHHRGVAAQTDLAILRARDALVAARTKLINHLRGAVKSFGGRLPSGSTHAFAKKVGAHVPEQLKPALEPLLHAIQEITNRIADQDRKIEGLVEKYPQTKNLREGRCPGWDP